MQSGYLFNLHAVDKGIAYFSAYSQWVKDKDRGRYHGRELREVGIVDFAKINKALEGLGICAKVINNLESYNDWLNKPVNWGWAFIAEDIVESNMKAWIEPKRCFKTPHDTYAQVELLGPWAENRRANPNQRGTVIRKYGNKCLICGKSGSSDNRLEMHHIRPYNNKGGATTPDNLIPLCKSCHEPIGNKFETNLYELAGIIYGFDPDLAKATSSNNVPLWLFIFSDNMMLAKAPIMKDLK